MSYMATRNQRQLTVSPYLPDRAEKIGDNTGQASQVDINKPVKLAGDTVELCSATDEIYGFIASVEAYTRDGHSIGGVAADAGREQIAVDSAGGLTVGAVVVAAANEALGTPLVNGHPLVAAGVATTHKWLVIGLENTPSQAGDEVLLRKI